MSTTQTTAADAAPQLLTREQFLAGGNQRRFKVVRIPGLGDVKIRSLKEGERARYETDTLDDDGETDREGLETAKRRLIIACVVDANGEPLLTPDDLDALADKDGAITGYLFDECRQHCGFARGDIERLVGNSSGTPDAGSR